MLSSFLLGNKAYEDGRKAVKSLLVHSVAEKGPGNNEPVYLIINTSSPLLRQKDYTPRIIPVTNSMGKYGEKSILLVTKDPSTPYRKALSEKGSPTEDIFNQIYSLTKLRTLAKDPRKLKKMSKEFDVIVSDVRVFKFLPEVLGEIFYRKNKKLPFMIQMAMPDPNAHLVKSKKSSKLKDERCDPRYIKSQIKSIVKNTYFIPSANGTCLSIKVGFSNWPTNHILQNIDDVLRYLVLPKYAPVGGVLRKIENIKSLHVKTSESASLPIYIFEKIEHVDDS